MTLAASGARPIESGALKSSPPKAASRPTAPPFASVACFADPAEAREVWLELEAAGGPYQTLAFAEVWRAAFQARVAIVVARDGAGQAVALLALRLRRYGPLTVAGFVGDAWANFHMGLFRPGAVWLAEDVRALLRAAARTAGIDLFAFFNQPARWAAADNPLRLLPGRTSPTSAFASALSGGPAGWLDAHVSRATQKKLRKKARKLEALGALAHVRARDAGEAARLLDAFFTHKAAQARARAEPDLFAVASVRALLRGLVAGERPPMEMHALQAGERIVAVLGALPHGRRLSGLVISYDPEREVAAATPGELMLIEIVRDAFARGFETFDLGVGESRYKSEICEIEEPLADSAFGATPLGRLAAPAYLALRAARGWIKTRQRLRKWVQRLGGPRA